MEGVRGGRTKFEHWDGYEWQRKREDRMNLGRLKPVLVILRRMVWMAKCGVRVR